MDFLILGPLEVRDGGLPVPIPGRHAPKLLALLVVDAGRFVGVDRLVRALWAENPPATAKRQVQNVMASLRRALPDPDVIEAGPNGYRLSLGGSRVDYLEFERLCSLAREAEPRDALRYLREASELWRGEALAGLTGNAVEAAAVKFNEARISVLEHWAELELEVDHRTDLIGDMRELVEAHPYRQRLVGLLMRALWYVGRAPEALKVYGSLRARLAEDLGLDPDGALVELQTAILCGAPEREPDRPEQIVILGPVPGQLPAAPSTFTGRHEHIAELDALLSEGRNTAVVSAIAGMGGAGKTALALHWGHRMRQRFPDGQLYINLRGYDEAEPVPPIEALGRFLVALGQSSTALPSDVESASAVYRSLVADRRMLVVLDNARTVDQVRPLLPGGAANFALVTSRDRLASLAALDDARSIRLDTLSREESLELLAHIVGGVRLHAAPDAAERIVELCGRLPLALRIAGANLAAQPKRELSEFADALAGPDRLEQLAVDGDPVASVAHSLELSVANLSAEIRDLLYRLALIPGSTFTHSLAIHLSELDEADAERAVSMLVTSHLIDVHGEDRYQFHDLIHAYVTSLAPETVHPDIRGRVQTRLIDWYELRVKSLPADEGSNVIAALVAWEEHPQSWKLATVAATFWRKGLNPKALLSLCERVLPAARRSEDLEAVPRMFNSIAVLHRGLGQYQKAVDFAQKALSEAERSGVGDPIGRYHCNLAIFIDELGKVSESVPLFQEAFRIATQANATYTKLNSAAALGNAYRILGKFTKAEHFLRMAIALEDSDSSVIDVNVPRLQLGVLFTAMGRLEDAIPEIDFTIATADRISSTRYQILARIRRATVARRLGDFDDAYQLLDRAIELSVINGHDSSLVDARLQLAELFHDMGRQADAMEQLSLLPEHDSNEPAIELRAEVARIRGLVSSSQGETTNAIALLTYAHELYASMPSPLMQARVSASLGSACHARGDVESARRHREQALETFTRLNVPEAVTIRKRLNVTD